MTTTNQAFIKAYRNDEAQSAPAIPAIAGAARPVAVGLTASVEHASTVSVERSALYGPRPADTVVRGSPDPAHGQRHVEKRPLSSFIAATGIARLSTEPAEADFFRPGTTVASFQWPAVCRALSRRCGEELDRLADLLIAESAAGRSLVGVLGLTPVRGASTTALCLAARLADRRRRVILVDGNFRRPQLATWLDVEPTAGWQDVLMHGSPLTDAMIRATDDRLDLLALGAKPASDPLRLVSGLQAVVTAGVLRHAYDHVLVDAGAFFDSASQSTVLELVRNMGIDAVLAITGPGPAQPRELGTLADQLGRSGCELLGTIENRVASGQGSRIESREPEHSSGS